MFSDEDTHTVSKKKIFRAKTLKLKNPLDEEEVTQIDDLSGPRRSKRSSTEGFRRRTERGSGQEHLTLAASRFEEIEGDLLDRVAADAKSVFEPRFIAVILGGLVFLVLVILVLLK